MIAFPNAKINLGLSVASKRPDGFHNLETVFYPLLLRDVLEISHSSEMRFSQTGLSIPGDDKENLVLKAFSLLKNKFPLIASLDIHLYKAIPAGAGLGGGSSDAAGMLKMLDRFFDLNISSQELKNFALELGSDCPFFLQNKPCFASGRGEILEQIALDLSGYSLLLVHSGIRINTGWAYSKIVPALPDYDLKSCILNPVETWINTIKNDFEPVVFESYPELRNIKESLYHAGATYASMSGSGSTIYGIFRKPGLPEIDV